MVRKYQMLTSAKKKICARNIRNENESGKGEKWAHVVRTKRCLALYLPLPLSLFYNKTNKWINDSFNIFFFFTSLLLLCLFFSLFDYDHRCPHILCDWTLRSVIIKWISIWKYAPYAYLVSLLKTFVYIYD